MNTGKKAVVIPCYKVARHIAEVIRGIPPHIEHVLVVDDACPQGSGRIAEQLGDPRVRVLYHPANQGVGAAMVTGYRQALELGCELVIKMDGDGQMDPHCLDPLIAPLVCGEADYAKGNRFSDLRALRAMPTVRLIGNNIMSFLVKAFSGYWNLMDPTNGYTAITRATLEKLDLNKLARRYFFESDLLLHLNLVNAVVRDVPMPARYGSETSSLRAREVLWSFPPRLVCGLLRRILLKYFIYDFNLASVYLLLGVPLFLWGVLFGLAEWLDSYARGVPKTAGTIMLAALPLIVSFEMLLQAIGIDIHSVPRKR